MTDRAFWLLRIDMAWEQAPIAWLCGVRRSGKTTLARSLGDERALYLNCDLPVVAEMTRDPRLFYKSVAKPVVIFDEVHRLDDPSRLLKVGADEFPNLRILATGSSTLAASRKFSDTLTGRKRHVHLVPVLQDELQAFGVPLQQRLYHGGLPQAMLAASKQPSFYREWMDSFFARDIQHLFGFRDVNRFSALLEYLLRQSGGQLDQAKTAGAVGISRVTLDSHLRAMEVTNVITFLRPFSSGHQDEIIRQPKIYGFDTGFVSFVRGWDPLRPEDHGILWEHLVLEWIQAKFPDRKVQYWRDKKGAEVDFVMPGSRNSATAIECKWNAETFDPQAIRRFRSRYPNGRNWLITPGAEIPYAREYDGVTVKVCSLAGFAEDGEWE